MSKSYKEDGRPAIQFYVNDWLGEAGLRLCSLAARGLWVDMLFFMFKSDFRGLLKANGKQIDYKKLSKLVGASVEEVQDCLSELQENNVYSTLADGTIYNRRMYNQTLKEREISRKRSEAGKQGGRPKEKQMESKGKAKKATTSSSSTSSSTSTAKSICKKRPFLIDFLKLKMTKEDKIKILDNLCYFMKDRGWCEDVKLCGSIIKKVNQNVCKIDNIKNNYTYFKKSVKKFINDEADKINEKVKEIRGR